MAQLKAQSRIREKARINTEIYDKEVDRMLEQTATHDSAIRAINLAKILKKPWNEEKNAYLIMSKLNNTQRKKLNDMCFNRYNDI